MTPMQDETGHYRLGRTSGFNFFLPKPARALASELYRGQRIAWRGRGFPRFVREQGLNGEIVERAFQRRVVAQLWIAHPEDEAAIVKRGFGPQFPNKSPRAPVRDRFCGR